MDYDACDHILWPYEPDDEHDPYDDADLMYAEYKLEKDDNKNS